MIDEKEKYSDTFIIISVFCRDGDVLSVRFPPFSSTLFLTNIRNPINDE